MQMMAIKAQRLLTIIDFILPNAWLWNPPITEPIIAPNMLILTENLSYII
jgi:hypothetical protein